MVAPVPTRENPVFRGIVPHLTEVTAVRENQNRRNLQKLSELYTSSHLRSLRELPNRQIVEIYAWVDCRDGVIQGCADQILPSDALPKRCSCVHFDIMRVDADLRVDDVFCDGLPPRLAEWFKSIKGKMIPKPNLNGTYSTKKTSPDLQKQHNRRMLQGLYQLELVRRMKVGQHLILEAWIDLEHGFIGTIALPDAYEPLDSQGKAGMMLERDQFGLLVYFNDLRGISSLPEQRQAWFGYGIHTVEEPDDMVWEGCDESGKPCKSVSKVDVLPGVHEESDVGLSFRSDISMSPYDDRSDFVEADTQPGELPHGMMQSSVGALAQPVMPLGMGLNPLLGKK